MSIILQPEFTIDKFLHALQTEAIPADTILTCQGKSFRVHRGFLASKLEYFRSLFDRDFSIHIEITDMTADVLDVIMTSFYYGLFTISNYAFIPDFLVVFQKINYQEAYEWYLEIHLKYLSKDNWETFWELGENLNEDKIFKAVCNLIRYNYNLPQFLLSPLKWKLFNYLSNNRDYEILVKIALYFTKDLENIDALISLIDFGELEDHYLSLVCRHPILSITPTFRDKGYPILCERFRILTENLFVSDCVCNLMLLGEDKTKSVIITYCSGTWKRILELNKEDFSVIHLSVNRNDLNVFGIQNNEKLLLQHTVYHRNIRRDSGTILASTFRNVKISSVVFDDTIIGIAYDSRNQCDFLSTGPEFTKYYYVKNTEHILRIQLVLCENKVFMVKQVKMPDDQYVLMFYKLSSLNKDREWVGPKYIIQEDSSTNWFAYFFPPYNITLRFIGLSTSLYFNFETQTYNWMPENNMIMGAVSMQVFCWKVICLSSDGWIYYQDLWEPQSDWKTISKSPIKLTSYQQVVNGIV